MGHRTLMLVALCAAGCAAAPKQSGDENNFDTTPTGSSATPDAPPAPSHKDSSSSKDDPLTEDQKAQMEIALRRGGEKAANCATVVPDAPRGEGEVKVTFDGKKGRATDVTVGSPWAGTPAESCIKRAFIGEFVVPFDGQLEVPYTIKLPAKGEPADDKSKGKKK